MAELITCPNCLRQTARTEALCHHCGSAIPAEFKDGSVKCPHCFKITASTKEACLHCGESIPAYLLADPVELERAAREDRRRFAPPPAKTAHTAVRAPPKLHEGLEELKLTEAPAARPRTKLPVQASRKPDITMKLLLRRSQKSGLMGVGKVRFGLDVRVELSPEMFTLVGKYKMGREVLYQKVRVETAGIPYMGTMAGIATALAARALNLTITVNDLVMGKHIECKDILEMRAAEEQIKEACAVFKSVLESAVYFEGEEVIEI